jgi:hypothetical protein
VDDLAVGNLGLHTLFLTCFPKATVHVSHKALMTYLVLQKNVGQPDSLWLQNGTGRVGRGLKDRESCLDMTSCATASVT